MPKLQLEFEVAVDRDGIVDGRELARDLIETAFKLLIPYVDACPACADNLFKGLVNDKLEELHDRDDLGELQGRVLFRPGPPVDDEAIRRHLDAAEQTTRAMMWHGDQHDLH